MSTSFASSRRRSTLVAVAVAFAVGAASLLVAGQWGDANVVPVSSAVAAPVPVEVSAAPVAVEAVPSIASASSAETGVATAADTAASASAAEPLEGGVIEPVDPAEVLFADHAAVAVSN